MNILFVDHFDSFKNNLVSCFKANGANVKEVSYHTLSLEMSFRNIHAVVFSPGPGHPSEYTKTLAFYKKIPPHIPFLGVCLGHQIFLTAEGAQISQISSLPIHGRQIEIKKTQPSLYLSLKALQGKFVLYNSLGCKIKDPVFTKDMLLLSEQDGFSLAVEHKLYPRIGVQYHPEKFCKPQWTSYTK